MECSQVRPCAAPRRGAGETAGKPSTSVSQATAMVAACPRQRRLFTSTERRSMVEFEDFTVKLLVIDQLMYAGVIVPPYKYGQDWLREARGLNGDEVDGLLFGGELFCERIPEADQWARDLELTKEQVESVEILLFDGGNEIFMLLAPSWDGEDDLFDPATWRDVTMARFPNLKELIYVGELEDEVRAELEEAGVAIRHL